MRERTQPPTASLVFDPEPGRFDEVTWLSPQVHVLRLGGIAIVPIAVTLAVLNDNWTTALPFVGIPLGSLAATRARSAKYGAGPAGLHAGRFAIPWDRVSSIDHRGYVYLDPPARMSKAVVLSGEMRRLHLGPRGWAESELGQAVDTWAPRLQPSSRT